MSDKVEIEFKFKVGDLVMSAASAHLVGEEQEMSWLYKEEPEMRYVVQERLYQQCYNTFQIHYTCRCIARNGYIGKETISFTEPLLVAALPFKTKTEIKELRKKAEAEGKTSEQA